MTVLEAPIALKDKDGRCGFCVALLANAILRQPRALEEGDAAWALTYDIA